MDERKSVYVVVDDEQITRVRSAMEDVTHEALNTARGGCVFCTYELEHTAQIRAVPVATQVVQTPRGPRDLCDAHAERGTWSTAATLPAPPEAP